MHYKKIFIAIMAISLLLSCSSDASNEKRNSLLWKIAGNGLEKPSYLFGTHHLVPAAFLDSIPGIKAAFEESEQTVGELDMSDMAEMQMQIMGEGMMSPEVTYATLLSPEDTALLDSMLHSVVGVGLDQLGQLKPAMLSNLISISLYQQYYPSVASTQNIDYYFQEEALKRSRPVVGLETAEDQIYLLLNAQSLERQAEMLICMIKHPEMLKEQMDKMQVAYHAQNLQALRELYEEKTPNDPCPSTEEEKNLLNGERNRKWLEKLPSIMKEKSSFIAVGCLHLPGKEGLIEGLRELGYTVEAMR